MSEIVKLTVVTEDIESNSLPYKGSEDEFATEFSTRHADSLRYVAKWGKWLQWDGARWKFESTLAAFDMARVVAREFAKLNADTDIAKASTVSAIERLARADRRHATTVDIWDTDPWALNTPGGIVDLRTGKLISHDPERYLTKITAVAPGDGECPLWIKFLERVTGGSYELQMFLQRIAGYALTGDVSEHALFFLYGTGRNGKGVYLNTISKIMADYAEVAPMETFIVTQGSRHPTELAGLRGARLVTSQETEENQRWAESKIKTLTGGDRIRARFMHQDFFEFDPSFKLFIGGNHKPGLRGVDEAIKARMKLIPFTVTIPEHERDKQLPEKLKEEWPAILQWMINGCLAWQRQGLNPPDVVRKATDEYLADEDSIGSWIDECCVVGPNERCASSDLWASWKAEREKANEYIGSQTKFGRALTDRGFIEDRGASRYRRGINLKPRLILIPWLYVPGVGIDFNDAMTQEEVALLLREAA